MDAPFSFGEENSLLDVIQNDQQPSPDNELISESLKTEVKSVLATLPEREAEVIKIIFWIGW